MTNFKTIKAAALALVLGLGIIASAHAGHRSDKVAAAIVVGSLIGAVAAANQPVYAAPPVYVAPGYGYYEPAPVYYAPAPVYVAPSYGYGYRHHHRHHRGYRHYR